MKKIFIIVFFTFSLLISAQSSKLNNLVEYTQTLNLGDGDWDIKYKLYFNKDIAFYQENFGNKDREVKNEDDGTTNIVLLTTENTANYYLTFLKSKRLLFGEQIAFDYYHFEENVPQIKWQLTDETKTIGKYQSKKAIGKFRGRTYTVWFTEEIPINVGPWKLNGLGGLILEATDDKGVFNVKATKIVLGKETDLSEKINKLIFISKRLNTNQYKTKKRNEDIERINYINAKLPEGEPKFSIEDQTQREFIEIF